MTGTVSETAVLEDGARMIEWARRVNKAWARCGETRAEAAEVRLNQLTSRDPAVLHRRVRRAFQGMMEAGPAADLRGAFYQEILGGGE